MIHTIAAQHFEGELYIKASDHCCAVKAAVAAEREACAKACENLIPFGSEMNMQIATMEDCAAAIRARGNT